MRPHIEQFQDFYNRIHPVKETSINGSKVLARNCTLQVCTCCNLKCSYCYQINKTDNYMTKETAKKFIDLLLNADSSNEYINPEISPAIVLEFIGGEPFMNMDVIEYATDYFIDELIKRKHKWATAYIISICSNGMLYFDERVQAYLKKHLNHLSFSISIDGNKELHDSCRVDYNGNGSYDTAISGVKHFTEVLGGTMGSKMTLAPENISHTYDAVINLIDLGYTEIFLNCIYEEGFTLEHARILYEQLKMVTDYLILNHLEDDIYLSIFEENLGAPKLDSDNDNWCGGTGSMISVDYKGDIYPCIRYMESSLGNDIKPVIIGDVDSGVMATKEQCDIVKCMNCVTRRSQSTDECFNCPIAEGCSWCSAYNYQEMGSFDKRATYICVMHKARVLANVYFWNLYFRSQGKYQRFRNNVPNEWALEIIDQTELDMLNRLVER